VPKIGLLVVRGLNEFVCVDKVVDGNGVGISISIRISPFSSSLVRFIMKIFKDVFNGDEYASDSFILTVVDDVIYEIETKQVSRSKVGSFDIGSNPSAEEGGDEGADGDTDTVTVNNLVDAHKLVQTSYDKKSYLGHIKAYMKRLSEHIKEKDAARVATFQAKAQEFVKKVVAKFDDYEFYTGESMDPEAMVVLKYYKEDGIIPYFAFWKDGVREEKY